MESFVQSVFANGSIFPGAGPFPSSEIVQDNIIERTLSEISLKEVGDHDQFGDCWIVVYDRVYDVTQFLFSHPGGEDVILDYAGRDATLAFRGTGHSKGALRQLNEYLIGELPEIERIFRTNNIHAVVLTGIPE